MGQIDIWDAEIPIWPTLLGYSLMKMGRRDKWGINPWYLLGAFIYLLFCVLLSGPASWCFSRERTKFHIWPWLKYPNTEIQSKAATGKKLAEVSAHMPVSAKYKT